MKKRDIYISTNHFLELLEEVEKFLISQKWNVVNINKKNKMDIFEAATKVGEAISKDPENRFGIIIDEYGSGGFMIASKFDKTIVAQLSDEHSAHMTRGHNNTNIITLGADLTAKKQILKLIDRYLNAKFEGGRHMVRIDMLDEMLKGEK